METKYIEYKNIVKSSSGYNVLYDFNFYINYNDKICVFGNDGVGKTLMLEILSGIEKFYSGQVFVDGIDRKLLSNKELNISYMMKNPVLLENLTVEDNIAYVYFKKYFNLNNEEKNLVDDAIDVFDLSKKRKIKVKKLSLANKKVINLCRIFCKNSKIILIDEPFGGLNGDEKIGVACGINLIASKHSSTMVCVDNGQNLTDFGNMQFCYLQLCQNLVPISLNSETKKIPDIYCYFFVKYGQQFVDNDDFIKKYNVDKLNGNYDILKNQIFINNFSVQVANRILVDAYSQSSMINLLKVDDCFFDAETGLSLNYVTN